jgi:hypothetical protein
MRAGSLFVLAAAALAVPAPVLSDSPSADTPVPSDPAEALKLLESLGESTFQQAKEEISEVARRSDTSSGCTLGKLQIRREW